MRYKHVGREMCYGLIASRHPSCRGDREGHSVRGLTFPPIKMSGHVAREGFGHKQIKVKTVLNESLIKNQAKIRSIHINVAVFL